MWNNTYSCSSLCVLNFIFSAFWPSLPNYPHHIKSSAVLVLAILVFCRLLVIPVLLSSGKERIYELSSSVFMSLPFKISPKSSVVYFNNYVGNKIQKFFKLKCHTPSLESYKNPYLNYTFLQQFSFLRQLSECYLINANDENIKGCTQQNLQNLRLWSYWMNCQGMFVSIGTYRTKIFCK